MPPEAGAAGDNAQCERRETEGPCDGLGAGREQRFQHERKRQQNGDAAGVAGRVEEIGVVRVRVAAEREPPLQQRRGCGECEERCAERDEEQGEEPGGGRGGVRLPAFDDANGQCQQRRRTEQQRVGGELDPYAEPPGQKVGVGVPGQQHGLEEHHRGVPNQRRAAE